jgi:hypothetical protein
MVQDIQHIEKVDKYVFSHHFVLGEMNANFIEEKEKPRITVDVALAIIVAIVMIVLFLMMIVNLIQEIVMTILNLSHYQTHIRFKQ